MTIKPFGFFQTHRHTPLKPDYWGELLGAQLGLKSAEGDHLTLYKSDYKKLLKLIQTAGLNEKELSSETILTMIKTYNQTVDAHHRIQVIKYFSPTAVKAFALDPAHSNFHLDGPIQSVNGNLLKKNGHQNCVVMTKDGNIFIHPKVRANSETGTFGINHSSLAMGRSVAFAGSLNHLAGHGWCIENTTGHYGTRITQMRHFLETLASKGASLADLTVKLWIPKNPKNPGTEESDYDIKVENALAFLTRTTENNLNIDESMSTASSSPRSPS